jgi:protein-S-isoprenylcysteine O-methyltransferase Ste14
VRPTVARALAALAVFAAAHSALAARPTKRAVRAAVGREAADGLYRPAYVAVAALSTGLLARYLWRLPDRPLYRVRGPLRTLLLLGQAGAALQTLAVAAAVGPARFAGWPQLRAALAGAPVPPPVVAQHPLPAGEELGWEGPFRRCRHPNNAFPLLAFWLAPTMTVKWAAVGAGAALYMLLGSRHEERRLAAAYGDRFGRYRRTVPHLLLPLGPDRGARHQPVAVVRRVRDSRTKGPL